MVCISCRTELRPMRKIQPNRDRGRRCRRKLQIPLEVDKDACLDYTSQLSSLIIPVTTGNVINIKLKESPLQLCLVILVYSFYILHFSRLRLRQKHLPIKMTIDMYSLLASPPCRSVLMVAKELDITLNVIQCNPRNGDHMKPEFLKVGEA